MTETAHPNSPRTTPENRPCRPNGLQSLPTEFAAGITDAVKGFLDPAEGVALYQAALKVWDIGPCLEVGSYCGKSAVYLARACQQKQNVLFCIDHHLGSEEHQPGEDYFDPALFDPRSFRVDTFGTFRQVLARAGIENTVVPLVCDSKLAARFWTTPLGLVFIDGGHDLQAVGDDYEAWAQHLLPGGLLCIHDIFEDPAQGGQAPHEIYRRALASRRFVRYQRVATLGILRRVNPSGV